MIEFELKTERFRAIIKSISVNGIIETPTLQLLPNRLKAVNKDLADAMLNYSSFKKSYFTKYEVKDKSDEEPLMISFGAERFLKTAKLLTGDLTTVQIIAEDNQIKIFTDSQEAEVPIIENPVKEVKLPSFTEEKDEVLEVQDAFIVSEMIPTLKKETNSLGQADTIFVVNDSILSVKQKTSDGYGFADKIKKVNAVDFSVIGDSTYLNEIFESVINNEVEIRLSKEDPIIVIDNTNDYNIVMILAPKLEM